MIKYFKEKALDKKIKEFHNSILNEIKDIKHKLLVLSSKQKTLSFVINRKRQCYERDHEELSIFENDRRLSDLYLLETYFDINYYEIRFLIRDYLDDLSFLIS